MKIPDLITTIVAYRTWQWDTEGIASLNCQRWIPGEALQATCQDLRATLIAARKAGIGVELIQKDHQAPDPACSCGIYAAKNFNHLVQLGYANHGIHGEVDLWGTVMEHRLGYRAQYAYPKSFTVPEDMLPYQMPDIENRLMFLSLYGVPIYYSLWRTPETKNYEESRILLWDKENGYSQAGVDTLTARAKKWYEYHLEKSVLKVGDRVAIKDRGIAIVHSIVDGKKVWLRLYNQWLVEAAAEKIVWSVRNNRWEAGQTGYTISVCERNPGPRNCSYFPS